MFLTIGAAAAALLLQGPYGGGFGGVQQTPGGDYQRSCRDVRINGGQMTASCNDRAGRPRQTTIPLLPCAGYPIGNDDGVLVCGRVRGEDRPGGPGFPGGPGGPGRPGGGRASITIFEDIDYRGRSQIFTSEVGDLSVTPFNDRISSFQLQGAWQVCTDAYFQGRCYIYERDQRTVDGDRLNDQISSMRPMGR